MEAMAMFEAQPGVIAVVLTDMAMPVMGGRELIEQIRAANSGQRVIAMSGMMDRSESAEIEAAGISNILSKPFTAEKLLQAIHQALGR